MRGDSVSRWVHPRVKIGPPKRAFDCLFLNAQGCFDIPLNRIHLWENPRTPKPTEETIILTLCHEVNHWAQWRFAKFNKYQLSPLLEIVADWRET